MSPGAPMKPTLTEAPGAIAAFHEAGTTTKFAPDELETVPFQMELIVIGAVNFSVHAETAVVPVLVRVNVP